MSNPNFALPRTETAQPMVTAPAPNAQSPHNPQCKPPPAQKGLPVWAWILIVVGILLLVTLIVMAIWYFATKGNHSITIETTTETPSKPAANPPVSTNSIRV